MCAFVCIKRPVIKDRRSTIYVNIEYLKRKNVFGTTLITEQDSSKDVNTNLLLRRNWRKEVTLQLHGSLGTKKSGVSLEKRCVQISREFRRPLAIRVA